MLICIKDWWTTRNVNVNKQEKICKTVYSRISHTFFKHAYLESEHFLWNSSTNQKKINFNKNTDVIFFQVGTDSMTQW